MYRTIAAAALGTFIAVTPALAAGAVDPSSSTNAAPASESRSRLNPESQSVFAAAATPAFKPVAPSTDKRPAPLVSMYAGLAALQAYDYYSTTAALKNGAHEANPMMSGVVGNPGAFLALKAGVTGVSIFASERLWRQHHRAQAVAVMALTNGFMAFVAAHNRAVLAGTR